MYTFIGETKTIVLDAGVTSFSTTDMYSRWKDWVKLSDNSKFLQAMRPVGGEPIGSGQSISPYIIMLNGWKVKPQEANHVLTVLGNIITDDESSPFTATDGNFNVSIRNIVTSNSLTVSTSGNSYSLEQIAQAVWDRSLDNHNTPDTFGYFVKAKLLTFFDWITLKDK